MQQESPELTQLGDEDTHDGLRTEAAAGTIDHNTNHLLRQRPEATGMIPISD